MDEEKLEHYLAGLEARLDKMEKIVNALVDVILYEETYSDTPPTYLRLVEVEEKVQNLTGCVEPDMGDRLKQAELKVDYLLKKTPHPSRSYKYI